MTAKKQAGKKAEITRTPLITKFEEWQIENWQRVNGLLPEDQFVLYAKERMPEVLDKAIFARHIQRQQRLRLAFPGPQQAIIDGVVNFENTSRVATLYFLNVLRKTGILSENFTEQEFLQICVKYSITLTSAGYDEAKKSGLFDKASNAGRPIKFPDTRMLVKILCDKGYGKRRMLSIINEFVRKQKDRDNYEAVDVPLLCTKGKRLNEDMINGHIRGLQNTSQDWGHNGVFIETFQDWLEEKGL